jgi:hypothetical protein
MILSTRAPAGLTLVEDLVDVVVLDAALVASIKVMGGS